jgi:hypothetical protein
VALALSDELMQKGIRRLLKAPLTLAPCGAPVWEAPPGARGSARHQELFAEYAEEVDFVTAVALKWWRETLHGRATTAAEEEQAVRDAWMDRPAGPASYPGVVALVRDYWLACHEINLQIPSSERIPPWTFLLEWLLNGEYGQCVSVLACMPYWPIGLDAGGTWR